LAAALTLLRELIEAPKLRKNNLHEYRLNLKELRNPLHMAEQSVQQPFGDRLGKGKDAIASGMTGNYWLSLRKMLSIMQGIADSYPIYAARLLRNSELLCVYPKLRALFHNALILVAARFSTVIQLAFPKPGLF
jgi:hypothetical protein